MFEEKVSFKWDDKKQDYILHQFSLKDQFITELYKEHDIFGYNKEYFLKVGKYPEKINMEFVLWGVCDEEPIQEINDIIFVSEAMEEIRKYKIINEKTYKIDDFLNKRNTLGEWVFACNGKPMFDITLGTKNKWSYKPFTISYHKKKGSFSYVPNLDVEPHRIDLEISVQNQKKEKLLVKMYKDTLKHYTEKGFEKIILEK